MIALGLPLPPGLPPAPLGLPAGCVIAYAGEVGAIGAPPAPGVLDVERWGWMVCDGRQLGISQYPELFAALGFRYVQPGEAAEMPPATQFRIPDYRGYFLRGVNGPGGADPDAAGRKSVSGAASSAVGSVQQHALQNHEHDFLQASSEGVGGEGAPVAGLPMAQSQTTGDPQPEDNADVFFTSKSETRPVNLYVYYLIRTTGGLHGLTAPQWPSMGPAIGPAIGQQGRSPPRPRSGPSRRGGR